MLKTYWELQIKSFEELVDEKIIKICYGFRFNKVSWFVAIAFS